MVRGMGNGGVLDMPSTGRRKTVFFDDLLERGGAITYDRRDDTDQKVAGRSLDP